MRGDRSVGDNRFDEYLLVTTKEVGTPLTTGAVTSVRSLGIASIVCAVLWLFGFGAIAFLVRGRATVSPLPGLRLAAVGFALGVVGLAIPLVWYLA